MRLFLLAFLTASALPAQSWDNPFAERLRDDFLVHWESTREYTLAVLDAMPDSGIRFRPTPEQRTFAEQLAHAAAAQNAYFAMFGKDEIARPGRPPEDPGRAEARTYLVESFAYVQDVLRALGADDFSRRSIPFGRNRVPHTAQDLFLRAYMHTAHHRGQAVVYLRLQGVTPPAWQFSPTGE